MSEVPDTVDDAIDPLSSPSTDEVFEATRPFSSREIASSAVSRGGGGGGGSVPEGSVVPVADPSGATIDDTSYDNTWTHSGKLTTLVFPQSTAGVAIAIEGDDFPRIVMLANPQDGFYFGNGAGDPTVEGAAWWIDGPDANGHFRHVIEGGRTANQLLVHGELDDNAGYRTRVTAGIAFHGDPLTGEAVTVSSGVGAPACGGNVGDMYVRKDGGDGSWIYRCTVAGAAGAATWVAKL